jgi:RNA polymerase sigma-70 factor (ECF subfamily)
VKTTRSPGLISDDALLLQIAQGREFALEELYDRYSGLVYSLAKTVVGDVSTAEEVTLDTFTQVWNNAASYKPQLASVKTWLATIARNRSIDAVRSTKVRFGQLNPQWVEIDLETIPGKSGTEEMYQQQDMQMRIRRAIAELPQDQKEVLALAYFRGYSHSQIARALNKPLGTVKTHIRSAMQNLRDKFEE